MKTKYLFYSLALAGMFAACTQEQLVNDESNATQEALKNRPVAGMVEFSLDEVDSRYNHTEASFNDGEAIDLYLMDQLNGLYDESDANHMHGYEASVACWKYFPVWSKMYSLVNYAQTRYPFAYDAANKVWKNDATLLEGNYIAMHPSNEKITNRRDVWHYINPVMSFTNEDGEFDKLGAMDNQFWLGYTPIYRDEDRTGEMTLPLSMQPIMSVVKLKIVNNSNNDTKIDKIVFKDKFGKALPTIAYVKPALMGNEGDWRKTEEAESPKTADGCSNLTCNGLALNSVYSKDKTWSEKANGRATARSLVQYATPKDRIPYGLEDQKLAYEYVFNFEEGGHFLGVATNGMSNVEVYFVLPNDPSYTYEPVIYGRINDGGEWKYGILKAKGNDNQVFTLNSIDVEKLTPYEQNVTASFDNNAFEAVTEVRVSTTEDLMKYLKSFETSYEHESDFNFNVKLYGDDVVITDEVVNFLEEKAKNEGDKDTNCPITLTFKAMYRSASALLTIDTDKDCMKYFNFPNGDVDVKIAKGTQTFEEVPTVNIDDILVDENATLNIKNVKSFTANVQNEGVLNIENTKFEGEVHNAGNVTLKNSTIATLKNDKAANIEGEVVIETVYNKNECVDCGRGDAVLTINGKLTVTELNNVNSVVNNGTLITTKFNNERSADMNGAAKLAGLTNAGTLNINSSLTEMIGTENSNEGIINVNEGAKLHAKGEGNTLNNTGTINVKGDLMQNIYNSGYVYVIENGHVIVAGSIAGEADGIIDISEANEVPEAQAAKDLNKENYYRYTVGDETKSSEVTESLRVRISSYNWLVNPIILVWGDGSAETFVGANLPKTVERVIINSDLTIVKGVTTTSFSNLKLTCTAVDCANDTNSDRKSITINGSLTVANDAELVVANAEGAEPEDNKVRVWVAKNGVFKANNTSKLSGDNVWVNGSGYVEIANGSNTWQPSNSNWFGDWHE